MVPWSTAVRLIVEAQGSLACGNHPCRPRTDVQQLGDAGIRVQHSAWHRAAELAPDELLTLSFACSVFERGYAQRMRRGSKVLLTAVLAVLIVVNVVLLFLLFRPDRVLTARPSHQDPGDGGSPTATSSPASRRLNESNALDSTNRVGSCQTAALGHVFQDGVARDCWRLQHPRQNRAVN